jgi:hypothetical protein
MKIKNFLGAAAMVACMTALVFAQHGRGGGRSSSMHGGGRLSSKHGDGRSSSKHGGDHSSSVHNKAGADHGSGQDANHSGQKSNSQKLAANTKLATKLQSLLPPGTNLETAASGFKNFGQFVAAVHVSHNLGIPFAQLKAKMLGPPSQSLGKAIQDLKPTANAKAETKKAESEARQDLDEDSRK